MLELILPLDVVIYILILICCFVISTDHSAVTYAKE